MSSSIAWVGQVGSGCQQTLSTNRADGIHPGPGGFIRADESMSGRGVFNMLGKLWEVLVILPVVSASELQVRLI